MKDEPGAAGRVERGRCDGKESELAILSSPSPLRGEGDLGKDDFNADGIEPNA